MIALATMPRIHPDNLTTRESLLARLRDLGDQASWQLFHDTYSRLLHEFAMRTGLNESDASDVVQETIIRVAQRMPDFVYDKARGSFKNWLLVCVRNSINTHHRRRHYQRDGRKLRREEALDTAIEETQPAADPQIERVWAEEWERHKLQAALALVRARAKPEQFQIFQLHVLNEQPVAEVAARLRVTARNVYWAKYRVTRLLKAAVREIDG